MFEELSYCGSTRALLSSLCASETLVQELRRNEKAVSELGNLIDRLDKLQNAYTILELRSGYRSQILILNKNLEQLRYSIYGQTLINKVDLGTSITVHDFKEMSIETELEITKRGDKEIVLTYSLTDTPSGLKIVPFKAKQLVEMSNKDTSTDSSPEIANLFETTRNVISKAKTLAERYHLKFVENLQEPELKFNCNMDNGPDINCMAFGKMTKVIKIDNTRYYTIQYKYKTPEEFLGKTKCMKITPSNNERKIKAVANGIYELNKSVYSYYGVSDTDLISDEIPYNLIDEGRLFVSAKCGGTITTWVSEDPKVNSELYGQFFELLVEKLKESYISEANVETTHIGKFRAINYVTHSKDISGNLKAIKKMVNEYKYITQKKKSIGSDISITDKIKYCNTDGKISYGDFCLQTDSEYMKNEIIEFFNEKILAFFRGEGSEESILNASIDIFFKSLNDILSSVAKEAIIVNLVINNKIKVKVEARIFANHNRFFYINDQRINKNEVSLMLKEISCYKDESSAISFLTNVGRIGLAVYMGVTSGYTLNTGSDVIYKFRKLKGRSNYELILDNAVTSIKGKKLLTCLYEQFLNNDRTARELREKIDNIIKDSVMSTTDFLRYRLLIDETYTSFKEQSELVLNRKIEELEGTKVSYLLKKTLKTAILIVGTSGNQYIIAYDSKGSWVFMNPTKSNDTYSDGSYICMVDQSNIKSSFSYDTVIAKLMAVKNDSVIAKQIYNLEEVLGGFENENGEENTN